MGFLEIDEVVPRPALHRGDQSTDILCATRNSGTARKTLAANAVRLAPEFRKSTSNSSRSSRQLQFWQLYGTPPRRPTFMPARI